MITAFLDQEPILLLPYHAFWIHMISTSHVMLLIEMILLSIAGYDHYTQVQIREVVYESISNSIYTKYIITVSWDYYQYLWYFCLYLLFFPYFETGYFVYSEEYSITILFELGKGNSLETFLCCVWFSEFDKKNSRQMLICRKNTLQGLLKSAHSTLHFCSKCWLFFKEVHSAIKKKIREYQMIIKPCGL